MKKEQADEILTMATIINNSEMLAILIKGLGQVGQAIQGERDLTEELVAAAAICIRWLEYKDPAE